MPAPHEPCSDRYSQINWMEDIEPTIAYNDQLAYEDYLSPDGDCVSTDIRRETDSTNDALVYYNHDSYTPLPPGIVIDNREKRRLNNINSAFECLKKVIPTFPFEKRLTKIDTLRLAISYISMLQAILESDVPANMFVSQILQGDLTFDWYTHELSARLNWLNWENLGMRNSITNKQPE